MFKNIMNFLKKANKKETTNHSKETAKERLQLVLMQDRANVSVDFLDLMRQEIIEVIKKYIDIDEGAMDVRLTNKENEDGTQGAPALYANIPIINIKEETKKMAEKNKMDEEKKKSESIVEEKENISDIEKNKNEENQQEQKEQQEEQKEIGKTQEEKEEDKKEEQKKSEEESKDE